MNEKRLVTGSRRYDRSAHQRWGVVIGGRHAPPPREPVTAAAGGWSGALAFRSFRGRDLNFTSSMGMPPGKLGVHSNVIFGRHHSRHPPHTTHVCISGTIAELVFHRGACASRKYSAHSLHRTASGSPTFISRGRGQCQWSMGRRRGRGRSNSY
eukprot:scaffold277564_cov30-Tisochrysis_lutea.AAC.1